MITMIFKILFLLIAVLLLGIIVFNIVSDIHSESLPVSDLIRLKGFWMVVILDVAMFGAFVII